MKRLIISIMAVILALGLMGSAFAYFEDSATSATNSFTSGTLGLQIADGNPHSDPYGQTVDHTWEMFNMIPGVSEVTNLVSLVETGTIPGDHIEAVFSFTPDTAAASNLGKWLLVDQMQYAGINLKGAITALAGYDANSNGVLDLDDLVHSTVITAEGGPLDGLPTPIQAGVFGAQLHMTIKFSADAPDEVQGTSLTMMVSFTLNQVATQ